VNKRRTLGVGPSQHRTTTTIATRRTASPGNLSQQEKLDQVYFDRRWRRLRNIYKAAWPLCVCGCGQPMKILDHIIPITQPMGMRQAFSANNVQGLTRACHGNKTERIDAPGTQPQRYRYDRQHEADMRPPMIKEWARIFIVSGQQIERVGDVSPGGSKRTGIDGDIFC